MSYGTVTEVACPGGCGRVYERVSYEADPPPIPLLPAPRWFSGERELTECECGFDLEGVSSSVADVNDRPIKAGYRGVIHLATASTGCLKTVCGQDVRGWWKLVDGWPVDCPVCLLGYGLEVPA